MKNGQILTKCRQEGHFSTFHLPKSFKFVEIFPKLSKKFLTTRAKITKFQNLCRMSKKFLTKHTIVHETKFHLFFAKQSFLHI